jgi:hypothetical protein
MESQLEANAQATAVPSVAEWLAVQELTRLRAQKYMAWKTRLHGSTFVAYLFGAFSSSLAAWISAAGVTVEGEHLMSAMLVIILLAEGAAMLLRNRANALALISRQALSVAMPCSALGLEPRHADWDSIFCQLAGEIEESAVHEYLKRPGLRKRFDNWWVSERALGDSRLAALLLENVRWTTFLVHSVRVRRVRRLALLLVLVLCPLAIGIALSPQDARLGLNVVVLPLLFFLLAIDWMGVTGNWPLSLQQLAAIESGLRGIDRLSSDLTRAEITSLFARYVGLTTAMPPVPSAAYDEEREHLEGRVSHAAIEEWLSGER